MKMKEAEARTGLDRKNIRYYEREELLSPERTQGNRYRDYSQEDIARLLEIRLLRQLGVPIKDIRGYFEGRLALGDLMRIRQEQIDGEMAQLKKMEQMCSRLEEQQTLKQERVEEYLEEISREAGKGSLFEKIGKDWKQYKKELHGSCFYFEPQGTVLTPGDFATETAVFAARNHMEYETINLEANYALVRLEGVAYQASLTYGFCFVYARMPLIKLTRCTPLPNELSQRKFFLFATLPPLIAVLGILFCLADSYTGARFSGFYQIILVGCLLLSMGIFTVSHKVYYL